MVKIIHLIVSVVSRIIMTTVKIIGSLFGMPVAILAFIALSTIGGATVLDAVVIVVAAWLILCWPIRSIKKSIKAWKYDMMKNKT